MAGADHRLAPVTADTQRNRNELAIPYLQQAIVASLDKRVLAPGGIDLAGLRAEDTIAALLDSPLPPARDHKRSIRTRVR